MNLKATQPLHDVVDVGMTYEDMIALPELWEEHFSHPKMCSLFGSALPYVSLWCGAPIFIGIRLTLDESMKGYNQQYRNKNTPTNILSFPAEDKEGLRKKPLEQRRILGDLVVNHEAVLREASLGNISWEQHMSHLLLHGFLHLWHYDHEMAEDAEVMESLESKILHALGWPNPYEER